MMGSMYAGVSGLKAHQVKMDVIGNNISNVNTVGFKKSTVNFAETYAKTIQGASAPQDGLGGRNPVQVGLGTKVSSVNTVFTQGNQQTTGRETDVRIDGDGFFVVSDGSNDYYTRSGNFELDGEGKIVTSGGLKVQGWQASKKGDGTTEISAGTPITDLNVKLGEILPAKATSLVSYTGNLDQHGGLENLRITVDADGSGAGTEEIDIDIVFKFDPNTERWNWTAEGPSDNGIQGSGSFTLDSGTIDQTFDVQDITNGDGTLLVRSPIPGEIVFTEVKDTTNTAEAEYASNVFVTSNDVYDSLGESHSLQMSYTKLDENLWAWQGETGDGLEVTNGKGLLAFDAYGQIAGNYVFADITLDETTPTDLSLATLATIVDGDGNSIPSYPSQSELGVAWDTSVMANYHIQNEDGTFSGDATSPYTIDARGIVKYRGTTDDAGNVLQAITVTNQPEEDEIMNNNFSGTFSFDPAEEGGAVPTNEGANKVQILPNFNGITQFSSSYTVAFESQDGYSMGELESFKINDNGDIMGYYSNNYKQVVGRIAISSFFNSGGLEKQGNSLYSKTPNSGESILMEPGTGGSGSIVSESLEMSNVDLAEEFTEMIIAQRGFQANSKTITTADALLQELINLKR